MRGKLLSLVFKREINSLHCSTIFEFLRSGVGVPEERLQSICNSQKPSERWFYVACLVMVVKLYIPVYYIEFFTLNSRDHTL
jgi:hypothetical protein